MDTTEDDAIYDESNSYDYNKLVDVADCDVYKKEKYFFPRF